MNKQTVFQWVGVAGLVLAVIACFVALQSKGLHSNGTFGTTSAGNLLAENYIPYVLYNGGYNSAKDMNITGGFTLGSSGTTHTNMISGTCNLQANTSIVATTTGPAFCTGITGLTSSDRVFVMMSSSTPNFGAGFNSTQYVVQMATASTTAGAFDVRLLNLTGTNAIPAATPTVGSSTQYWILH